MRKKAGEKSDEKVTLLNPKPGVGNTNMARWKYNAYREAILKALAQAEPDLAFKELPDHTRRNLPPDQLDRLGSITWHVTSVKLDLEAGGLIERVPGKQPQRLRLTTKGRVALA